jgi:hypothetical protein
MAYSYLFDPVAAVEYEEAFSWYEKKAIWPQTILSSVFRKPLLLFVLILIVIVTGTKIYVNCL